MSKNYFLFIPHPSGLIPSREEDVHVVVVVECAARETGGDERRVVEVDDRRGVRLLDDVYQLRGQGARVVRREDVGRLRDAVVRHGPDVNLAPVLVVAAVWRERAAALSAHVGDDELVVRVSSGPRRGD